MCRSCGALGGQHVPVRIGGECSAMLAWPSTRATSCSGLLLGVKVAAVCRRSWKRTLAVRLTTVAPYILASLAVAEGPADVDEVDESVSLLRAALNQLGLKLAR